MHGRMRQLIGLYDIFYKGGSCTLHKMGNGNILGGGCMFSPVRWIIGFQIFHYKRDIGKLQSGSSLFEKYQDKDIFNLSSE